jgi:hypothetical protein
LPVVTLRTMLMVARSTEDSPPVERKQESRDRLVRKYAVVW